MGAIRRSITHWTAGSNRASAKDKKHYHRITEGNGRIVRGKEEIDDNIVTSDGDYAAHTLNMNGGSGGFAMAGMHNAKESPFNAGPYPITEKQFEAHCAELARFHNERGILPITRENCLTHAEVEPTLGVKQRGKWDLTRLPFKPEIRGALPVGDYMRSRVRSYLGILPKPPELDRPMLVQGMAGKFVEDLQWLLADKGFFTGKRDGIFGPRTKAAVQGFQGSVKLKADGIVGNQTWMALMKAKPLPERGVTTSYLREAGSRTIKDADKGQITSVVGGVATTIAAANEAVSGAAQGVSDAEGVLGVAQRMMFEYWPLLLVVAACAVAYFIFDRIKKARVDDARSGRNMGR